MADWPPMKPVSQQHEKENTYLTLVDMFVDVVEPSIIQMILQEKNWDLDAALEDIMILASDAHVDKSRQKPNESLSGLGAIKSSNSELNQRKSSYNCASFPDNSVKIAVEQPSSYNKTPFNSGKKNSKLHSPNTPSNSKDTSNTKPTVSLPFLEQYNYIKSIPVSYDRAVMLVRDGVKLMVILRGAPGSGKSHLARKLLNDAGVSLSQHKRHIFSTDDFFVQNNVYLFVHELLNEAHMWNQRNVATAIREQVSPIVVDNTNTQAWEMRVYVEMAVSGGYDIEILEPVTWWFFKEGELAKKNVHGVPKASIRNMIERYERGLTPEMLLQKFNLRYLLSNAPPQPVHKSKWKDKLSNQTNNKPKKKKRDNIKKSSHVDDFIHDSLTSFPSNSVGECQTSKAQYTLNCSEKDKYVSLPAQNGKPICLKSFNQSTSSYSCQKANGQNFLSNTNGEFTSTSNPFLDFQCNSTPILLNSNPFMENCASNKSEYNFKAISQLDDIGKHGYDNLKSDSSKNTYDFMVETKKMLAALGTLHRPNHRNEELKSDTKEECNGITELSHSTGSIEECTNQDNNEIKNIASGVIDSVIQNVVNEPNDKTKRITSLLEESENEWEYVLVNSDGTFTYKRANADPLKSNFSDKHNKLYQQYEGPTSTGSFHKLYFDRNTSIWKISNDGINEQHIFQNEDIKTGRSNSLLNVTANSSYDCQKEVLDNNVLTNNWTIIQNCADSGNEETKTSDHITSSNKHVIELFGTYCHTIETENSEKDSISYTDKSVDGFKLCNVNNINSKHTNAINSFSGNKEHIVEAVQSNKSPQCEPVKLIDDVTPKDYNEILISKEMPYESNHVNNLVLTTEFLREEVNSNTSNSTKVLGLFNEEAVGKSDDRCTLHEGDSSTHSDNGTVCAKNKNREDLMTTVHSKVNDKEEAKYSEEEYEIHEDSSYDKEIISGKPSEIVTNENCAVVLEMMEDILKSMAPLSNKSPETVAKDFKILNNVEEKELNSTENGANTNLPSTSIFSDWESGECWLPDVSKQSMDSSSTEIRQPKPARNMSRPKAQTLFSETSLCEPKENAPNFIVWDTVSNPLDHWDALKNDSVVAKEKPIVLSQRVKLGNKKLTDSSTNTNYQDFSLIKEGETAEAKIIIGNPRNITEGFCDLKSDMSEISETLQLEKSTMTNGNFLGPVKCYDIAQINNLFPNIPKKYIFDMVEKCHGDINWAVDLLLDSEHSIYEKSDVINDEEISVENICSEVGSNTELKQNLCSSAKSLHLVPEYYEVRNESANIDEQSKIKQMIENSVVIGKEHYSDKVLKVLKKKRPEYLNLIESSQLQIKNQSNVVASPLSDNVCNTEQTDIDDEMSDEVSSGSCDTENDDDTNFEVVVNNDLILQLQQKFGNSNVPKFMDMTPIVKLPVSLARQLYGYIMDTLQSNLDEKQDVIENMISQDEEIARILQSQDEHFKPQLQEIMDMEVALEVYRADQENLKEKSKSTVAARLSKNILLEKFPQVDPKMLMEVFHAHNFSLHDTVASLELGLGVPAAQPSRAQAPANVQDQIKEVGSGFAEEVDLSEEAQAHRDQAASYYLLRMECLSKAHEAFRSGNKPVASYYSQLAQMHKDKITHCNSQAAACLVSSHTRGSNTLDLHFLHVMEAQVVLDMFLDETITQLIDRKKKHQTVYLITGRGLRSVGGVSRIKPMVLKTLNAREIVFNDINPGMVSAILRATTPLSHSL